MSIPLRPMPVLHGTRLLHWLALLGLAGLFALGLGLVKFPAAPLLGALVAGIVFGAFGSALRIPRPVYLLAQGAAGVFIASAMSPDIFSDVLQGWPMLLVMTLLTLCAAFAIGWTLQRITGIEAEIAVYGSLPGMSGAMVVIATERGADARIVALMQYVRLAGVIVSVALLANLLPASPLPSLRVPGETTVLSQIVAIAIAASALVAARLRALPAAGMLIPMLVAAAIEASGWMHLALPVPVITATFGVIGLEVGLKFTRRVLGHVVRLIPAVLVSTALLIVTSAGFALLLCALTDLDLKTAFLATAPGSIETVALVAFATKANVAAVLAFQTVRMFTVVLFGPFIVSHLVRLPIWRPKRRSS